MKFFSRSILNKLFLITGLGTFAVLAAVAYGVLATLSNFNSLMKHAEHDLQAVESILDLSTSYRAQIVEWKNVILRGEDKEEREKYWTLFTQLEDELQSESQRMMDELPPSSEAIPLIRDFRDAHQDMGTKYREALEIYLSNNFDARLADQHVEGMSRKYTEMLNKASHIIVKSSEENLFEISGEQDKIIIAALLGIAIAIVIAFAVFLVLVNRTLIHPAQALAEDLRKLASGDFTVNVRKTTDDELGQVAGSTQQLQQQLGSLIKSVTLAAHKIADSTRSLSQTQIKTSQRAGEQQMQASMVATAMNEMTASAQEVAHHANDTARAVQDAADSSELGRKTVRTTVTSIQTLAGEVKNAAEVISQLEKDSENISRVLDVIRGIAEQTNLLALNAAIEAARAGEQGRGFAVVADEVRSLAQRTAQSTAEIHSMIEKLQGGARNAVQVMEKSTGQVNNTVSIANEAGNALESIYQSVMTISDMSAQIATAAGEQTNVAEEINQNVITITQAAENTAADLVHSTQASNHLDQLAKELQTQVSKFRIQ